jgi:hypothetical protein
LSAAIIGAKPAPPPPPSPVDPQVGYIKILTSGARELRLAREDGTGSIRLAATGSHGQMTMALGPKSQGLIAYVVPGQLHLLHFVQGSMGPQLASDEVIATNGNSVGNVAISPTGSHIAWITNPGADYGIHVYSVASHLETQTIAPTTYFGDVDFSADGSRIIYSENLYPTDYLTVRFKSVPVGGGGATDLGIEGKYGNFSVGPTDEIVADTMGDSAGAISLFPAGATSPTRLTNGYYPAIRCDSAYVIFQRIGNRSAVSINKYELASGLTNTFSSSGNYWPDYFPDC